MRSFSFKQTLILMLMLLLTIVGVTEYAVQSIANTNLRAINSQQDKLAELNNNLDQLKNVADNNQVHKNKLVQDLYPIEVAANHGYGKEVGLTIIREANKYGLRSSFIMGLIEAESTWRNPHPNEANAQGLMQVTTGTGGNLARDLEISNPDLMDPITNIRIGTYCIAQLIRNYGDVHTALTAYNCGEGGMQLYVSNYGTSRSGYSRTVLKYQEHYENQ